MRRHLGCVHYCEPPSVHRGHILSDSVYEELGDKTKATSYQERAKILKKCLDEEFDEELGEEDSEDHGLPTSKDATKDRDEELNEFLANYYEKIGLEPPFG